MRFFAKFVFFDRILSRATTNSIFQVWALYFRMSPIWLISEGWGGASFASLAKKATLETDPEILTRRWVAGHIL
jgi:hypothetical protein